MKEGGTLYRFYFLFMVVCLAISSINAQDLSYYILGEAELKNSEIYSVLQTQDQRLYVATDEGLYEYKHGAMQVIESAEGQLGTSLFNLRENSKGDVYCYNLNGQIFKVVKNNLVLYRQTPGDLISQNLDMEFDDEDNLIFVSNGCFIVREDKIEMLYDDENNRTNGVSKFPDGRLVLAKPHQDTLIFISKGKLKYSYVGTSKNITTTPIDVFSINEKLVYSNVLNELKSNNSDGEKLSKLTRYFQFDNQLLWRKNITSGVETLEEVDGNLTVTNTYFDDIFISEIAKGPTGLLFFGTFGKGLIVVPNLETKEHNLANFGKNIQSIAVDERENVFISDRVNGIFKFQKEIEELNPSKKFVPEKVFVLNEFESKIHLKFPKLFYNTPEPIKKENNYVSGALKNVQELNKNTLLFSTSRGIEKYGNSTIIHDSLWKAKILENSYSLIGLKERCSDAVYDIETKNLYISTISSLLQITKDGTRKKLLFKGKAIIANDLLLLDDKLWVATQDYGILIFENDQLVSQLSKSSPLENPYIYKLVEREGLVYVSHKTGFQIFNTRENEWRTVSKPEGIESGTIEDFALGKDNIWFAANTKLYSIPIKNLPNVPVDFKIKIDSILVGTTNVGLYEKGVFNFKNNELTVNLDFKGILFEKEAQFHYQLIGLDKKNKQVPATQASINYNFIPPGDYTFEIYAQYRTVKSDVLHYSFTINKPYWQTWWFISFAIILLLLAIALFTRSRNRKLKKSNQERLEKQLLKINLVESELKALRAQMNPHFIFNSLNSIQDLILQEDTEASYDYIVLFSDLVRNALNYSNESFISLKDEIEFLEAYLKLEKLRFGGGFKFKILNTANSNLKIPSLIVQPFVENAIVHGVFHKEGLKTISIQFEVVESDLICTITDNGIGRKQSKIIQERQGKDHESFALTSITKRLEMLGGKYNQDVGFTFEDLEENNSSKGTKVKLILPLID